MILKSYSKIGLVRYKSVILLLALLLCAACNDAPNASPPTSNETINSVSELAPKPASNSKPESKPKSTEAAVEDLVQEAGNTVTLSQFVEETGPDSKNEEEEKALVKKPLTYGAIVEGLRMHELDADKRIELIEKIVEFPSSHAFTILWEVINLDPNPEIIAAARKSYHKIKKFIKTEDTTVMAFECEDKKFRLSKIEFLENVMLPPWRGNVYGYARYYLLDSLLDCELDKNAGKSSKPVLFSGQKPFYIPSQKQLNTHIESIIQKEYDKYTSGPQTPEAMEKTIQRNLEYDFKQYFINPERSVKLEIQIQKILALEFENFFYGSQRDSKKLKENITEKLNEKFNIYFDIKPLEEKQARLIDITIGKIISILDRYLLGPHKKKMAIQAEFSRFRVSQAMVEYYSEKKIKSFLWRKWLDNLTEHITKDIKQRTKRNVLKYLAETKLNNEGRGRTALGPQKLRNYYAELEYRYERYLGAEDKDQAIHDDPELEVIIRKARAKIQGVWFRLPSLKEYQKKDEAHYDEAKGLVQGIYDAVFNEATLENLKDEALSIFDIQLDEEGEIKEVESAQDQGLTSEKDETKKIIADNIRFVPDFSKQDVAEALDFLFTTARELILEEKSETDAASIAFIKAMGEAKGRYYVLVAKEKTHKFKVLMGQFFSLIVDQMSLNLRRHVIVYLEKRLEMFQDVYGSQTNESMSAKEKEVIFQKLTQAYIKQYPAEFISVEPDWVLKGETFAAVQRIEFLSFHTDPIKQPGDTDIHYHVNDPVPSISLFQWTDYHQERLYALSEETSFDVLSPLLSRGLELGKEINVLSAEFSRNSKSDRVFHLWLHEALFFQRFYQLLPQVESDLIHPYRMHLKPIEFTATEELDLYRLDFFKQAATAYKAYF